MLATLVGGFIGLAGTILGIVLAQVLQRKSSREAQILEARVQVYGECAKALYDYERATYARASTRIDGLPEEERNVLRQDAYRCEFAARSAIGQATFLSETDRLDALFDHVRERVEALNRVAGRKELNQRHQDNLEKLRGVLVEVRAEMRHGRRSSPRSLQGRASLSNHEATS